MVRKGFSTSIRRIGEIADVRMGYPFRSRLTHDVTGSVVVIQMKDIDDTNRLHVGGAARVDLPDVKEHHLLKKGDLVFRSRGQTNTVALVSESIGPAVLAAPLLLIRPVGALPAYLYWYINLPATQASLAAKAEGTAVRMISTEAIKNLELPFPSRERQQLIAEAASLARSEQQLLDRIAQERKRLADGMLLRYAKTTR